ncbi:hypothetical protein BV898_10924 [Hypsibius exemplaris]|uniref:Chitin-binding type-4 domain-containing protein n=1 Tax=Hypsibius exemplaris TaxID=2072580 RepID=A0A1W0WI94_HYPEX|nr:hypothetical protein BV898_10924 [Hypsibius exemplaris]
MKLLLVACAVFGIAILPVKAVPLADDANLIGDGSFGTALENVILDRIQQGQALQLSVEDSHKIVFQQESSGCNTCGNNSSSGTPKPNPGNGTNGLFTLIPTSPLGPFNNSGVHVPCGLPVNLPIPGYSLTQITVSLWATNAVLPIQCDNHLTVTDVQTDDPGLSGAINAAHTGAGYVPYVSINPLTLAVVPHDRTGFQPIPDPGNYFTQTICGTCLDQRAFLSNSFCLRITWWGCSGNCVANPAKSCSSSTEFATNPDFSCNGRTAGEVCNYNTQCCGVPTCSATGGTACFDNTACTAPSTCVSTIVAGNCCTLPNPSTSCLIVGGTSCTSNADCDDANLIGDWSFGTAFEDVILNRIQQGQALQLSVEDSHKIIFQQESSGCNTCGNNSSSGTPKPNPGNGTNGLFTLIPTSPLGPFNESGVHVSCGLLMNLPIPGYSLTITWWGCSGNCMANLVKSCSTSTDKGSERVITPRFP